MKEEPNDQRTPIDASPIDADVLRTDHESRLYAMIEPGQQTWDLSDDDVAAIRWVLERLDACRKYVAEQRCKDTMATESKPGIAAAPVHAVVVQLSAWLDRTDPELKRAWGTFSDPVQLNCGEAWQYMGSSTQGGKWRHCFRHRCDPETGDRTYKWIDADEHWEPAASHPVSDTDAVPF